MARQGKVAVATLKSGGPGELRAVRDLIAASRRSRAAQSFLQTLLAGTALGLGFFIAAQVINLVSAPGVPPLRAGLAGLLAGLAGFGALAYLRRPSISAIARDLDARLQLSDRLSTAIEIGGFAAPADSGARILRSAFIADTERAAAAADARAARPTVSRRLAWSIPALLAASLALAVVDSRLPDPSQITASDIPSVTPEERQSTDTALREIADIVRERVAVAPTPALEALARTIDTVRSDLAASELDRTELAEALADLSAQAGALSQSLDRASAARIEKTLGDQIQALERGPAVADPLPGDDLGAPADKPAQADPKLDTPSAPLPTTQAAQTSLQPGQAPPKEAGPYYTPDPHAVARENAERAASAALNPGTPAGGAKEADRGGNQAGEGVRPLMASLDDLAALSQSALESVVLPENDASAGQRVRINTMPPDATPGAFVDGTANGGAWQSGEVEAQNRRAVPAAEIEILKRYFPQSGGEF